MKTIASRTLGIFAAALLASNASSSAALVGEELAVIQAMAVIANRDAQWPFDFLYYKADFPASRHVASSMSNPDRTQYCGLSREAGLAMVKELTTLTGEAVEFDKAVAKPAGLSIGHKKLERFRYLTLSRVVFAPDLQHAWMAVDLNGASGAVFRMEKVAGEWQRTDRCAGWVKAE